MTEGDMRRAVLADITAICEPSAPLRDDEVTINQMAAEWNRSTSTTQTALDLQVDEGGLEKRKALNPETGRECWAYRVQDS